jgi:polysaccharide pyruvyl transferase WcaK-like protein
VGWDKLAQWGEPERIYTEFIKLGNLARKAGWEVKWFVLWPPDLAITRKLAIATNTENEIYEVYTDVFKYLDQVRSLSTYVGTRLHSVALATCDYVPSIMLEYRPKCRDYMASIGLEDWTLRTDQFRADEVWDKLKSWNGQRRKLSELLFKKILPLKDKQRKKAEVLMEIVRT